MTPVDEHSGEQLDDPNRQAVGLEPAWVEGTGGEEGEAAPLAQAAEQDAEAEASDEGAASLDELTKEELLAHAKSLGASPANNAMSKDELRASIEAHQAG